MKRRLNYTNRKSFSREQVAIHLRRAANEDIDRFSAQINIPEEWKLNPDAAVYVEAYVKSTSMRFPFGTVGQIQHPSDTVLADVDQGAPLFRVKIVDESGEVGLLLASADEIRPREEHEDGEGKRAFFPLVQCDLGEVVWKVQITRSDAPRLLINNRIPSLRDELLNNSLLQGAILPVALQQVLSAIVKTEEFVECDWVEDWRRFVTDLGGEALFEEDDDSDPDQVDKLIDSCVQLFCDKKRFSTLAKERMLGGDHD